MGDTQAETFLRYGVEVVSPNIVAIITARGGSKGLPRKNIRMLNNKPLISYSIMAALQCRYISRCIVSTEDPEIKKISIEWGADVISRPDYLATDQALSRDVVRHVLETVKDDEKLPEYFVLLQPTSPLRTAEHLSSCIEKFLAMEYLSAVSMTEVEHHPYKDFFLSENKLEPLFGQEYLDKPRQSLPRVYRQNGAIYLMRSDVFLAHNSFCVSPIYPFVMDRLASIDIDTQDDLMYAELIMQRNSNR